MVFKTTRKRHICTDTEHCKLRIGKNNEFISVIQYTEQLGFDTAALTDELFMAFKEQVLHIRAAYPEAERIDYFLDLYSDDLYIGLFRRLYGDKLDELKFEPLSLYQLQYFRCISGEPPTVEQLSQYRESIEKLLKTQFRGDPYYSFCELLPFKLVRIGDIRGVSLPFETEYIGISNPAEEIFLRLSKIRSDSTEEYFKDELKTLEVEFAKLQFMN